MHPTILHQRHAPTVWLVTYPLLASLVMIRMMNAIRIAALAPLIGGAAVGLAGSASADSLDGSYTATVTGGSIAPLGITKTWVFTPCGPGCVSRDVPGRPNLYCEFHLQGDTWTCSPHPGISDTVDANTLVAHSIEPGGAIDWRLTRN